MASMLNTEDSISAKNVRIRLMYFMAKILTQKYKKSATQKMKTDVIPHGVTNVYGNNTNAHEVLS